MKTGIVYLIGAGPGDLELITLKGFRIIQEADAIVYDRLVNPSLLRYRKKGSEVFYVGKSPEHHTLSQEKINDLLVKLAKEGKIVARVKGGDPYVFGRGGEECETLFNNKILFEVVPGITSAIAAPSYAGIPVTHRNIAVDFTVVTGHEDPNKENSQINWKALAQATGTLVFLMGVGNLSKIVYKLTSFGKSVETPVGLIHLGTRSDQKVVTGTLENIVTIAEENHIQSPTVIVVGDVVNLRTILSWYEKKPLFGKRITITRTREQASVLSEALEKLGAESWEFPTIRINENIDHTELNKAIDNIEMYTWLVFTSVNAFNVFRKALIEKRIDIRKLNQIKVCAIGSETKKVIEEIGIFVDVIPETFVAEDLEKVLVGKINSKDKVLVPRSNLGRKILIEVLCKLGAEVTEVTAYETVIEDNNDKLLYLEKLENSEIQMITFTSSSTVDNFIKLIGEESLGLLKTIPIASIGPVTSKSLLKYGLVATIEAKEHSIAGLVEAIKDYYSEVKDNGIS